MVTGELLRTHLDYTAWASNKLVQAASALSPEELNRDFRTADGSVLGTLVHIFAADRLWLARVTGASPTVFLTDADRDLAVLQKDWPVLLERWKEWAAGLHDEQIALPLAYADMSGKPWSQPLWQVVMHLVNHGTHHRGQVSGFLRAMGHKPPGVDLVFYYRELQAMHASAG